MFKIFFFDKVKLYTNFTFKFPFVCKLIYLRFITGNRLDRKLNIGGFQYGVLLQNVLL